jgi:hypothetical protein
MVGIVGAALVIAWGTWLAKRQDARGAAESKNS